MTSDAPSRLTRAARRVRRWFTVATFGLAIILVLERLGYAGVYRGEAIAAGLLAQLVFAIPAFLYLAALWQLRGAAGAVAAGAPFGGAVVRGLSRTGLCLIAGSLASLAMPLAHLLLGAEYFPRSIDLDINVAILAAIGGGLLFLARLVGRAASLETELDAIF